MESILIIKKLEIFKEYKDSEIKDNDLIEIITNKILDIFEVEYAKLIVQENPNYTELDKFIMFFINGKLKKQIKYNLWTAMAFYKQSDLTRKVMAIMREKYFK
jgi:uncharacterized protein YehS (DUF1456 family)